jgi:hypothetical protein
MTKLWRALALVGAGALVVGVAVAIAGVPHLSLSSSTFDGGTTTKGGGKTTTTLATTRTMAAASSTNPGYVEAHIFVHFTATGAGGTPYFEPDAAGTATWACANTGGNFPVDPKKTEGPLTDIESALPLSPDKKGKIVYTGDGLSITLTPPSGFVCPSGQTALLVELNLTSLTLKVYDGDPASGGTLQTIWDVNLPAEFVNGTWTRPGWTG